MYVCHLLYAIESADLGCRVTFVLTWNERELWSQQRQSDLRLILQGIRFNVDLLLLFKQVCKRKSLTSILLYSQACGFNTQIYKFPFIIPFSLCTLIWTYNVLLHFITLNVSITFYLLQRDELLAWAQTRGNHSSWSWAFVSDFVSCFF